MPKLPFEPSHRLLRVGFICTHNSCRSQLAEALARARYADVFEACSAGTNPIDAVNPDAARVLFEHRGIDLIANGQHPKTLDALEPLDIAITMGCGVSCPTLPCARREDWGLDDPSGQDDAAFLSCIEAIEKRLQELARSLA